MSRLLIANRECHRKNERERERDTCAILTFSRMEEEGGGHESMRYAALRRYDYGNLIFPRDWMKVISWIIFEAFNLLLFFYKVWLNTLINVFVDNWIYLFIFVTIVVEANVFRWLYIFFLILSLYLYQVTRLLTYLLNINLIIRL